MTTRRATMRALNDGEHHTQVVVGLPTGERHPCRDNPCDACLRHEATVRGRTALLFAKYLLIEQAIIDNDGVRG